MSPRREVKSRLAIGLISGTSMDGIDAALIRIAGTPNHPRVRLLAFETQPYPSRVRSRLFNVATGIPVTAGEISALNFILGDLFARAAVRVCARGQVPADHVSIIGSHGQTVFHQGLRSRARSADGLWLRPSTLQISEPAVIARRTGIPVVSDFRTADIAAGGQGAPLVPLVDYLLLRQRRLGVVALNIGGIANVTVIPRSTRPEDVFGFDTGPGNMVIDGLVRRLTEGRSHYDRNGRRAAGGRVLAELLEQALKMPFFRQKPPKSAGREQFGEEFISRYFGRTRHLPEDLLCTATELTARTIADAVKRFVLPRAPIHRLIVSGGGAHNRLLMARIRDLLQPIAVLPSDEFGLPADAKEAIAFALLADRTSHGLPGNLPAVTGASDAVVLGKITRP